MWEQQLAEVTGFARQPKELLGIAGRYMEMQCRVTVEDGTVLGGEWRFSQHLIHEYNSHYVKAP